MKALTIPQPYASLIAAGVKRIETRTWPTEYRGLLAIHAGEDRSRLNVYFHPGVQTALQRAGITSPGEIPLGAVVAIARLADVVPVEACSAGVVDRAFGEFSAGRFAWLLEDVKPVDPPIRARGQVKLWDWQQDHYSLPLFQ